MIRFRHFVLTGAAAFVLSGCGQPAANSTANNVNVSNTNANAAKPVAAAPTKEALFALEKQGWEAWKNRDASAYGAMLSDHYVGFGPGGRVDKAGSIKSMEQKCEVKSYSLSDEKMDMVGPDVAVLSFRAAQDYTCDGKKGPADVWSAAIYAREGNAWKPVYYSESPVIDPKAPPVKPAAMAPAPPAKADESPSDAATNAMMSEENKIWEAWKNKDANALESVLGPTFFWVAGTGRSDRASVVKMWTTDNKCEIKSVKLTEPKSVSLSSDVSLLTYKGGGEGTCGGEPIRTEWYAALYNKNGDTWKPSFGTSVP